MLDGVETEYYATKAEKMRSTEFIFPAQYWIMLSYKSVHAMFHTCFVAAVGHVIYLLSEEQKAPQILIRSCQFNNHSG